MIILSTTRQFVEVAVHSFFPYIDLLKQTKINNVAHKDPRSDEFLSVIAINCILSEIQALFHKKLFNTKSITIRLDLTIAQGIVLFKTLSHMPFDERKEYLMMIVSDWIFKLDKEMIRLHIHEQFRASKVNAASTEQDYYEFD
jgi:hypothetical protein